MIWAEIKKALNSTVAHKSKKLKPLDEIMEDVAHQVIYQTVCYDRSFAGSLKNEVGAVPEGVSIIDNIAKYQSKTTMVLCLLPNSVKEISDQAFDRATLMTYILLPRYLKTIGSNAFYGCEKLTKITIPENVDSIGESAFSNCSALRDISFKGTPASISSTAFGGTQQVGGRQIYVPWSEGEVDGAPWGATSATIHYNCEVI